jgi:hypothetical protein
MTEMTVMPLLLAVSRKKKGGSITHADGLPAQASGACGSHRGKVGSPANPVSNCDLA